MKRLSRYIFGTDSMVSLRHIIVCIAVLALCGLSFSGLSFAGQAADEPPESSAARVESDASDSNEEKPAEPRRRTVDLLDRELLRDLVPELPLDAPPEDGQPKGTLPDELDRAVKSMRDVTGRLDRKDVSEETSRLQTSILDDIDGLIERLKNQPPPQSSSGSPNQDQQDQNPEQSAKPRNQQQNTNPKNGSKPEAGAGSTTQSQAEKSEESSETNPRQAEQRAAALARRRALINEVWGHLPPALRERLLNVQSEKLLPGYESLIRRYYESLAAPRESR